MSFYEEEKEKISHRGHREEGIGGGDEVDGGGVGEGD
jgi:hypothetical protein